jgi:HAD superfamily phosphoserine phosphatase-like hydrolase
MPKKQKKPLAIFDLDGSLFREQLLRLLFMEFLELQIFPPGSSAAYRQLYLEHRDRVISYQEYEHRLIELFNERIGGKLRTDIMGAAKLVAQNNSNLVYTFSHRLIERLSKTYSIITVTGSLMEVVGLLAPQHGFEYVYATELETKDGKYTGKTKVLPVRNKKRVVLEHVKKHGGTLKGSIALGDTDSDIPMLSVVDLPIAFNPNWLLTREAERRGWPIVIERKDVLYVNHCGSYRTYSTEDVGQVVDFVLGLSGKKC